MACLSLAMVLPHWVTTKETVPPLHHLLPQPVPKPSLFVAQPIPLFPPRHNPPVYHSLHWSLDIHIGLFSICPEVSNLTNLSSYARPWVAHISITCSPINYTNLTTLLGYRDLQLWAPVRHTVGLVSRIRCFMLKKEKTLVFVISWS